MQLSDFFPLERIERDGEFIYTMFPGTVQFQSICYVSNSRFISQINNNLNISAVITTKELADSIDASKAILVSKQPAEDYYLLHNLIVERNLNPYLVTEKYVAPGVKIHASAIVAERVQIHNDVEIGPFTVIENDTIIGANSFVGPNVEIGVRGMQNVKLRGRLNKILYNGGVRIGEGCEILSHAIIQKPYQRFFTEIGNDTQISVKTSVGHGSVIGNQCQLAGGVTVAGNVNIGNNVWIGPGCVIADGIQIGDKARILMGSVVMQSVAEQFEVSGNFAQAHVQQLKNYAKIKKL